MHRQDHLNRTLEWAMFMSHDSVSEQPVRATPVPEVFQTVQHVGIASLIDLAHTTAAASPPPVVSPPAELVGADNWLTGIQGERDHGPALDYRRSLRRSAEHHLGDRAPVLLAPRKETPGALNDWYDVPEARLRQSRLGLTVTVTVIIVLLLLFRHVLFLRSVAIYFPLLALWVMTFTNTAVQWLLSWWDRPYTATPRQQRYLATLRVTVSVPTYNEDPELLDRSIWTMMNQTRPPQRIHVVDDGSKTDYSAVRSYWEGIWPGGIEVVWTRQENRGKKFAQTVAFASDPDADVFITVDSDTCLEHHAIEEGLKPLADPSVASVAGIELLYNAHVNWITRMVSARNTVFQLMCWGAQSAVGDVLINRGTYALYRAPIIREIIPAYIGETFLGHPVKLGDDSALTLFSRAHGRTVQQVTAFSFPMHPQNLGHHFRQWLRWARGSTVRNCWRIRYLPIMSYGWWYVVLGDYMIMAFPAVPAIVALTWPSSERFAAYLLVSMIISCYMISLRIFSVCRSDETWWDQLKTALFFPGAMMWSMFVLRWIKLYGIVTCLRQGWVTRSRGVEVTLASSEKRAAA